MAKNTNARFNFIEQLVWWEGQINTTHLIDKYDITRTHASHLLKEYRQQYPDNLIYDKSVKAFLISDKFRTSDHHVDFANYLNTVAPSEDQFNSKLAICALEVEAPLRNIHAEQVRPILKAIREQLAIDIGYISLSTPDYLDRIIEPHALVFDGLRWHVRAYCRKNTDFRDFTLSRFNGEAVFEGKATSTAQQDKKWQTLVDIVIQPDPRLTVKQQDIIANDFQMQNGRKIINTRVALVNYLLLRLRIDGYKNIPEEQQIILTPECQKRISQYLPR
ncbi:MAG: WYL domain-containing protein [Gammaproteobacteria bacterium]|nr:MAG: WYL domain-containing protein [Gammaproteobacteria bacterium]